MNIMAQTEPGVLISPDAVKVEMVEEDDCITVKEEVDVDEPDRVLTSTSDSEECGYNRAKDVPVEAEFVCEDKDCETCKQQQYAYCYLHFHPCNFLRSDKCCICYDLSRYLAKCSENEKLHIGCSIINCVLCGTIFDSVPDMQRHSCNTISSKHFECFKCKEIFVNLHRLMKHILLHCGLMPYNCQQCLLGFLNSRTLRRHEVRDHKAEGQSEVFNGVPTIKAEVVLSDEDEEIYDEDTVDPLACDAIDVDDEKPYNHDGDVDVALDQLKVLFNFENLIIRKTQLCSNETCRECSCNKAAVCFKIFHFCNIARNSKACSACDRLQSHMRKSLSTQDGVLHINYNYLRCCYCLNTFQNLDALRTHDCEYDATSSTLRCYLCGVIIDDIEKLDTHLFHHYKIKAYACRICGKDFVTDNKRMAHERGHSAKRKHKCNICQINFIYRRDLKNHMFNHGESKPFGCDLCDRSFAARYMLREHLHTHSQQKPHSCKLCNRSFVKKRALERHIYTAHQSGGITCEICGKKLSGVEAVTFHKALHEKEALHKCPHCSRAYTTPASLKRHIVTHTNTRLTCNQCGYSTFYSFQLKIHQLRHEEKKPFNCTHCVRSFLQKRSFLKHLSKCPLKPSDAGIIDIDQSDGSEDRLIICPDISEETELENVNTMRFSNVKTYSRKRKQTFHILEESMD